MKFIVQMFKNKKKEWQWHLRKGRHILAHSEEYSSKTKCHKTAFLVCKNMINCKSEVEEI